MKVIIFGGSGMVGQGVLRECLLDPRVEKVLSIGRTPLQRTDPKITEIVSADVSDLAPFEDRLSGYDACFFCLGVSSLGMSEADYRRISYDLTLAAAVTLARLNPGMILIYVSGTGTDSTEQGRIMWARVKGATENALLSLPFKDAYMFRAGAVQPLHGIVSKTKLYRLLYTLGAPLLGVARRWFPDQIITTEEVGRAMIRAALEGAPKKILENRDIRTLAQEGSQGPAAT